MPNPLKRNIYHSGVLGMRRVKQSRYLFRSPWFLHIQDNLSVKIPVFFEEKQSSIIPAHFSLTR